LRHNTGFRARRPELDGARITDVPRRFKTFPVDNDRFAPALRCGEFAIVDTSDREPEEGKFVFYRNETDHGTHRSVHQAIVRLLAPDQSIFEAVEEEKEGDRPLWMLGYGRQWVGDWARKEPFNSPDGFVNSNDGPLTDRMLRENIVGSVVGVLRQLALIDGRA
jgi:hypothetical protein